MKNILLTGGAGYIGSSVAHFLLDKDCKVTIVDNLVTGNRKLVPKKANLLICDIADKKKITKLIKKNNFDIVMHFAGLVKVDESIKHPKKYNIYNYKKSKIFFDTCFNNNLDKFIFSSTASVYGNAGNKKVSEKNKPKPLNPYAKSKLKIENYLIKQAKIKKINYLILRYFNVAGADKKLRTGLISKSSTNLIKVLCEVATGERGKLIINGKNHNTKDGTTIRDFVDVNDLSEMHYLAGKYLIKKKKSGIFNCGYGKGYSILEVLNTFNRFVPKKISASFGNKRPKDIEFSVSDIRKFKKSINWKPKFDNLENILKSSYLWEKKLRSLML